MEEKPIRKEHRTTAVLPVRIYGLDATGKPFNSVAHTLNVSKSGALLANIDVALQVGDVIGVQKGVYKSKFRIAWAGKKGTISQGQIGIECVDGPKNIWGIEDRPHSLFRESESAQQRSFAGGSFAGERRCAPRYACDLGVQIRLENSEVSVWSRCTDLSEGGCYIDSRSPLDVDVRFRLTLFLEPEHLVVPALVRTSFQGMGIKFLFESEEQAVVLHRFLRQKFGASEAPRPTPVRKEFPALDKLAECVEQLSVWCATAELETADRDQLEECAFSLRQDLQGLRAELTARQLARDKQPVVQETSA
jgi:hypothetical protein